MRSPRSLGAAVLALALLATSVLAAGCGTLFNERVDFLPITSNPGSADILVDGAPVGQTPLTIGLDTRFPHRVAVELEGYQSTSAMVNSGIGIGWLVLDIFTGLIGVVVDAVTGGWNEIDASGLHFELMQYGVQGSDAPGPVSLVTH